MRYEMTARTLRSTSETSDIQALRQELKDGRLGSYSYVRLLGLKTFDTVKLQKMIEKGLAFTTFSRLMINIGLTQEELADVVSITTRTLNRRKKEGRLEPVESDRLLRTSRIFGNALQLFEGDANAARAWMSAPVRALGGMSPLQVCRTELGANEVSNLIGRLEHGVFT